MNEPNEVKDWEKRFDELCDKSHWKPTQGHTDGFLREGTEEGGGDSLDTDNVKHFIRGLLSLSHQSGVEEALDSQEFKLMLLKAENVGVIKGVEEGKKMVLNEIEHVQRKLLDGFSHPKDCPTCAKFLPVKQ